MLVVCQKPTAISGHLFQSSYEQGTVSFERCWPALLPSVRSKPAEQWPRSSLQWISPKGVSECELLSCVFATPWTCSPSGSSVHGILQAKILERVAIPYSRGSSWLRDRIQVSWLAGKPFTVWATGKLPTEQLFWRIIPVFWIHCALGHQSDLPRDCLEHNLTCTRCF